VVNATAVQAGKAPTALCSTNRFINVYHHVQNTEHMTKRLESANVNHSGLEPIAPKVKLQCGNLGYLWMVEQS